MGVEKVKKRKGFDSLAYVFEVKGLLIAICDDNNRATMISKAQPRLNESYITTVANQGYLYACLGNMIFTSMARMGILKPVLKR